MGMSTDGGRYGCRGRMNNHESKPRAGRTAVKIKRHMGPQATEHTKTEGLRAGLMGV